MTCKEVLYPLLSINYSPRHGRSTIKYHQELDKMRQKMLEEDEFDKTFSDSEPE